MIVAGMTLPGVPLPAEFNYLGIFLTLTCRLQCPYCLNQFSQYPGAVPHSPAGDWIRMLNRIQARPDLPLTLQGGEPTDHPDFYDIVAGLKPDLPLDLLTNLQFDIAEFARRIPPTRFRRNAPYASIRASYHPGGMGADNLLDRAQWLLARGYSIGIWGVLHPAHLDQVRAVQLRARERGIDFRTKEYLGYHEGRLHGTYRYPDGLAGGPPRACRCRPTELLAAPDGQVYRCHRDLLAGEGSVGSLADPKFTVVPGFQSCRHFGTCHPCDLKLKTNRFQEDGHSSVTIRLVDEGAAE